MKKIKHVDGLPKWFSIEKYSETTSFDTGNWWRHLFTRAEEMDFYCRNYQKALYRNPEYAGPQSLEILSELSLDQLAELVNDADFPGFPTDHIIDLTDKKQTAEFLSKKFQAHGKGIDTNELLRQFENEIWANPVELVSSEPSPDTKTKENTLKFASVHATTIWDAHWIYKILKNYPALHITMNEWNEGKYIDDNQKDEDASSLAETPFFDFKQQDGRRTKSYDNRLDIQVNLDATDRQILEDFSKLLKTTRNNMHRIRANGTRTNASYRKRKFSAVDFQNWAISGVLAYIDLDTWASISGVSLSHNLLGQALYPNDYSIDRTERIRQTVKPLAASLTSHSTIEALYAQMTDEEQEQ